MTEAQTGGHRRRRWRSVEPALALALVGMAGCHHGQAGADTAMATATASATAAGIDADVAAAASAEWRGLPVSVRAACRADNVWHTTLMREAQAASDEAMQLLEREQVSVPAERREAVARGLRQQVFWRIVRNLLLAARLDNVGGVTLAKVRKADGSPLVVFRSAFTAEPGQPGSCVDTLIRSAGVRHIVNLYSGPMPTADLVAAERAAIEAAGGTYVALGDDDGAQRWREDARDGDVAEAAPAVAALIRRAILRPGGAPPTGNVHVHCGGGMHRTGMVMGVIERCLGGLDDATVRARYKRHVGWIDAGRPGGFEPGNLDLIFAVDCDALLAPDKAEAR